MGRRPAVRVARGERVLSSCALAGQPGPAAVAATRDALYLPAADGSTVRLPWEEIERAEWDSGLSRLRVTEVGRWGEPRRVHEVSPESPGRFLRLVREQVTASVVLQRYVAVPGGSGLRVIARRPPNGRRPVAWFFEYDAGVDPDDLEVREAAERALDEARADIGDS